MARTPAGLELLVQGVERVALVAIEQTEPYLNARVRPLPIPDDQGPEIEALRRAVLDLTAQAIAISQAGGVSIEQIAAQAQDPLMLAYLIGSMLSLDVRAGAGPARGPDARRGPPAAPRLPGPRAAGARAAAEDRQPGPDRDEQGAARIHAPAAAAGDPAKSWARTNPERPGDRGAAPTASTRPTCPTRCARKSSASWDGWSACRRPPPDYQITRTYLELVLELPWRTRYR